MTEYERRVNERRIHDQEAWEKGEPIIVKCEECGKRSEYPAQKKGSVQNCLWCKAYVDVGDDDDFDDWKLTPGENDVDTEHAE